MTVGELERAFSAKRRQLQREAQEKATFDYAHAELVGRSIARIYNKGAKFPEIYEVYPTLFDNEELKQAKQEKQAELSSLRFRMFANAHNEKLKQIEEVRKLSE
jgi:hypothetical protein